MGMLNFISVEYICPVEGQFFNYCILYFLFSIKKYKSFSVAVKNVVKDFSQKFHGII